MDKTWLKCIGVFGKIFLNTVLISDNVNATLTTTVKIKVFPKIQKNTIILDKNKPEEIAVN